MGKSFDLELMPDEEGDTDRKTTSIELIGSTKNEVKLASDEMEPIKRRILIGIHTYGQGGIREIASYINQSVEWTKKYIKDNEKEIKEWLSDSSRTPCLTKAELVSRLCVEAETAATTKDRIASIKLLMDFRGLTSDGGSKSFARIAMRFAG